MSIPSGTRLFLILWKTWRAVSGQDRKSIEATGLGLSDFAVLESLLHKGPLPINAIGHKVGLTSGSITTAVQRLEKRSLLTTSPDRNDARMRIAALTPTGRSMIRKAFREHEDRLEKLMAP